MKKRLKNSMTKLESQYLYRTNTTVIRRVGKVIVDRCTFVFVEDQEEGFTLVAWKAELKFTMIA